MKHQVSLNVVSDICKTFFSSDDNPMDSPVESILQVGREIKLRYLANAGVSGGT